MTYLNFCDETTEGRMAYRPERCEYNNKDKANSQNILIIKNYMN